MSTSDLEALVYRVRPAAAEPEGLLVLFHGRGADEHDLFPLFDILDPDKRLLGATPRGPMTMPPGGAHWYVVKRVGFPDPASFWPTFERASSWLDALVEESGLDYSSVALGGFSQGCVMSYALSFAADRPAPAAMMGFSGFIPEVEGLDLDLTSPTRVAIGHGTYDPVIEVSFGRDARERFEAAGADFMYREYPLPHTIDPDYLQEVSEWLSGSVPGPAPR
ncbi:MAG TPA: phospholipase [Actinomycetota bacterium]|nr:phospholipase [Actinomycetota bacterium]